jgi:oxygen-independent coproporphyrinogen-3 oxidase
MKAGTPMARKTSGRPDNWSLYLHVPFCRRKCPYCDFFSVTDRSLIPAYVDGVCKEIQMWSEMNIAGLQKPMHTFYMGGGTPSVLSESRIAQILETVYRSFDVATDVEITMEVNPGAVDTGYLSAVRGMGINRLSIGAQSFDPAKLSFLSRIHTREQVFEIVSRADLAGFSNLGLDLMYALPIETSEAWQKDLDTAVKLQVPHLSCYMLTLEPGTPFHDQYTAGGFIPCDADRRSDFFVHTSRVLETAGYEHYEVSNFAKDLRFRSIHNTHYWERKAYLGVGPSAHSFLPHQPEIRKSPAWKPDHFPAFLRSGGSVRFWNPADIHAWLDRLAVGYLPGAGHEILTSTQEMMERIMLGLRTDIGVDVNGLHRKTRALMEQLAGQDLGVFWHHTGTGQGSRRFRLTRAGLTRLDSIVAALVQTWMT